MKTPLPIIMLFLITVVSCHTGWSAEKFIVPTSLERAKELLTANKPAEALPALSSYRPSHEEMSAYHYAYARALVALKQPYDSIEHYRLAYVFAGLSADKERMLIERADVYAAMGYYSEAAVCYDVFLKQFPRSSFAERAELGIAESRFKNGEFRQALVHYEEAGTSVNAVLGKANALQALGRTAEAYELYRALIEHDPKVVSSSPETLYSIGENFRQTGKPKDARLYYESVKDPVLKYRAALGLGFIAVEEKNFEAAVMRFTTAAESPERVIRREAILNRAGAQMQRGKYDAARAALEEIRNKYPYGKQYDEAVLLLAKLYRKEGNVLESVALLKTLIYRRSPVSAALDELEAMVLEVKDRDLKEFEKLWTAAGRWLLDPSRSKTIVTIAKALRHTGKPFLDTCTWLIKYGPEDAKAEGRLLLADFYADLGDASTAWTFLNRTKIKGNDDDMIRLKAKIYLANNDARSASEAIMSLREPGEPDLLRLLEAMMLLKNSEKAVAFCEEILREKKVSTSTMVRFADVLYDAGQKQQSLEYYRNAVAAKPVSLQSAGTAGDIEWAHYRIAAIAKGEDAIASLKTIHTAKNAVGRFAAAELKSAELRRKVESDRP